MKALRMKFGGLLAAALITVPAWGSSPPKPGTVNYVEGQASINGKALSEKSVGSSRLRTGQTLTTSDGRAEILLAPGIFFRIADHSAVRMMSPGLADTVLGLDSGRAMVEVDEIHPANNVRIAANGANTQLLKPGLYDFDAAHQQIRVFDGKAIVQAGGKQIQLKSDHLLTLAATGKLKAQKFDKNTYADDFYRWSSLRSSYLAEANVDMARTYAGGAGCAPSVWYGDGWYWDPWFSAYTFIPYDGIFWDPFGWGFYSPWFAFGAPYFGYGYGGFGYYHGPHHFGPGYHPPYSANRSVAANGHGYHVGGGGFGHGGFARGAGFARGGGFAGGGFHGGGFGGGGFHGGGGGRGR